MYAGQVIESGTTEEIMTNPKHPYTVGLLEAVPSLDHNKSEALVPIEGAPPNLAKMPPTCPFLPRCKYATEKCKEAAKPELRPVADGFSHMTACFREISMKEGQNE